MISPDELLKPITAEKTCGEDLAYDVRLQTLETLAKGKEATQFSEAAEPNWKEVRDLALELFAQSKDLRVVVVLAIALLRLEGLTGFRDALCLCKGLLEQHWNDVYPHLDPEDGNDPLQRINILSSLTTKAGTFQDPYRFIERLRAAPLSESKQIGRFSLSDIHRSQTGAAGGSDKPVPQPAQIEAAFRDTPTEELLKTARSLSEAVADVKQIDQFLEKTVGVERAPDFDELLVALGELQKVLSPYLPQGERQTAEAAQATGSPSAPGKPSGAIESRQDVVRVLDQICSYYTRSEPSSPVPFLLRRARRLVEKDFIQIIEELSPSALDQVKTITGQVERSSA